MTNQEQVLTTDLRRKGFKRLLKILSKDKMLRRSAVSKLTGKVKVKDEDGIRKEPAVYDLSKDASDLVRSVVASDDLPVDSDGRFLVRTDLENEGDEI